MHAKGYATIPVVLCDWITFLGRALPPRSVRTFIELLIGAMLCPSGFVTETYLILDMSRHWTSYYKWLQKGQWSWLALCRQFARCILKTLALKEVVLVVDDTLTLRASKKAPGSQIHHQHGNKPNLAAYVRGQCWVTLAMVVSRLDGTPVSIPLLSRLIPAAGNTGKLVAAKVLMRCVGGLLSSTKVKILVDSWYMRRIFIEAMVWRGYQVIGQVRKDTRLYDPPVKKRVKSRGRPRKYGPKYTAKRIAHLKRFEVTLRLYGKDQAVRYRSKVVKARFLKGHLVRAVWCEFKSDRGHWKKACLMLSTEPEMTAEQMISDYAKRWSIESMFHELKQAWGLKEAWQQTRQTLHRWVHMTMIGYGLIQLLTCVESPEVRELCDHSPWRKHHPLTAGRIRTGLTRILRHVNVRSWWHPTCQIFKPPDQEIYAKNNPQ